MRWITRFVCALAACTAILPVLSPPLTGAEQRLFFVDMTQHLLLMAIAAPLIALSGALEPLRESRIASAVTRPLNAWLLFFAAFVFWHWPPARDWAMASHATRLIEDFSLLGAATLFWTSALAERHGAMGKLAQIVYVISAAIVSDLLILLLMYGGSVQNLMMRGRGGVVPIHDAATNFFSLLMWLPANLVFFAIAVSLIARIISDDDLAIIEYLPAHVEL